MRLQRGLVAAAVRLLALAVLLSAPALATAAAPEPARLSTADQALVGRVEAYFNGVRTMRARFLQSASTGQTAEGSVALQRPIYHDRGLNQISYLPLGSTPAGILVEDRINLDGGGLTIVDFSRAAGIIRITVVRTQSPADGSLTLAFSESPLELKQWRVVDAQGVATTVSLSEIETGIELDAELFRFVDPRRKAPDFPE